MVNGEQGKGKNHHENTRHRLPTSGGPLWRGRRNNENTKLKYS